MQLHILFIPGMYVRWNLQKTRFQFTGTLNLKLLVISVPAHILYVWCICKIFGDLFINWPIFLNIFLHFRKKFSEILTPLERIFVKFWHFFCEIFSRILTYPRNTQIILWIFNNVRAIFRRFFTAYFKISVHIYYFGFGIRGIFH